LPEQEEKKGKKTIPIVGKKDVCGGGRGNTEDGVIKGLDFWGKKGNQVGDCKGVGGKKGVIRGSRKKCLFW